MSFAFASYNDYGIVLSTDRCLTGTNEKGEKYLTSNNCRKLFLSRQGFALSYTGCSSVNGEPIPAKISDLWEMSSEAVSLSDFFSRFMKEISKVCKENIIFLAVGYENEIPKIYTATTSKPEIKEMNDLAYSGVSDIGEKILTTVPIVYNTMTLQDRLDFHRFVTRCVSKLQYYSDQLQTVSEECDIVAIGKNGVLLSCINELY